ncbi:MAG: ATP-binding protein [Lachnospiraceae bacterium]|nr:ATP-binding protein [Lachnospiraceae bacterium]
MKKPDIDCPPYAPILMESTRAIGYSTESAIADILDNSIAAGAKEIQIFYNTMPKPYIAFLDNGKGMNEQAITEAMRYGSSSPIDEREAGDLGRYGLGMKMASLSQCRCLSVISKQGEEIQGRRWDLNHIIATESWSLEQLDIDEIEALPESERLFNAIQGTLVLWQDLDKIKTGSLTLEKALEDRMIAVKQHLELVFHRYLSGDGVKRLSIMINGVKLAPFDPFFVTKSTVVMDDEKIDLPGRKGKVIVTPYVLPHPSNMSKAELDLYGGKEGLRSLQGFYIYRNKRLLTWGTWFGLTRKDEFTKLARVKVDIPNSLDDLWTLDIKKSTAYPPEIVKTRLKQLISTMTSGSKRSWTFRQKRETNSTTVHVWNKVETRDGIRYIVNQEHPALEALYDRLEEEERKLLKGYLDTVQNNLPLNNLHMDLNQDAKIICDSKNEEKQKVLYLAKTIIKDAIRDGHIEETMKNLEIVEPFSDYIKDIEMVYKEVKKNG